MTKKYKLTIFGRKIKIFLENNKKKWTIFFIHGINSSSVFASNLSSGFFNHIKIDLPITGKNLTINLYRKIIQYVVDNFIKTKYLILLGHSLAGAIIPFIKSSKIKKVIFLAPLNPYIMKDKYYVFLRRGLTADTKDKKAINFIMLKIASKLFSKNKRSFASIFISQHSPFIKMISEEVFNLDFIKKLEVAINNYPLKSLFILGEKDKIISTDSFLKYFKNSNKSTIKIIKEAGHNPILSHPKEVLKILGQFVPNKSVIIRRKILKINKKYLF